MRSMADNTARIAELRATLEAGVTSTSIAGTTVSVDLSQIRIELTRLLAEDDTQRARRPRISSVNLSGIR